MMGLVPLREEILESLPLLLLLPRDEAARSCCDNVQVFSLSRTSRNLALGKESKTEPIDGSNR